MLNSEDFRGESGADVESRDSQRRLADFEPGERCNGGIFALCDLQLKTAKNRNPFLSFRLRDCTGERSARWFSPPENTEQELLDAQLVRVWGTIDSQVGFRGDFRIDRCEPIEAPEDLTPFLRPTPADHKAHRARFFEIIRAVKSEPLQKLLKEIFHLEGELWRRFESAPAAQNLHHAYPGGLLEHSGEVALLCERIASTLPHLDRDLLLTAALLHDIGKIEEMESGLSAGEYTAAGHLVGHVILGACTVSAAIDKIDGFPVSLKHELMHLILSHHGRQEHGSVKPPMCAEAVVLSQCDLMSARVAQCREKISDGASSEFLMGNDAFGWDGRKLYLGIMQRMMNETATES